MVNNCKCKSCGCGKSDMEKLISNIDDNRKPFTEREIKEGVIIRNFEPGYPEHLYKWHIDEENRLIEVLEDSDWKFQYDNELPTPMLKGIDIKVPKGVIHRIHPGKTKLSIIITKE